jgi:hypothetical protein
VMGVLAFCAVITLLALGIGLPIWFINQ